MKNVLKKFGKCLIIYVVLCMIILSSVTYGYSSADVRSAVAGYAQNFVNEGNEKKILRYTLTDKLSLVRWDSDQPTSEGVYYFCCATFVSWIYEQVAGIKIRSHNCEGIQTWAEKNCEDVSISEAQPGDILLITRAERKSKNGHTAIVVGDGVIAHAKTSKADITKQVVIESESEYSFTNFKHCYRIKDSVAKDIENLDTTFSIAGTRGSSQSLNYSKFFFNGVPDGQYSLAKRTFWQVIIDTIGQVLDFIVNLVLYIIRAVIVGFTAIAENILSWMVNVVSDTNVEDKSLDMSSTEASTSDEDTKITVDKIFFNKLELFDINIFDVD